MYSFTEIAKLVILIGNDLDENSFSKNAFRGYNEDGNLQYVKEVISKKIKKIENVFDINFLFDFNSKNNKNHKLTRYEALVLIFIILYPATKNTFISNTISKPEAVKSEDISKMINQLLDFLLDERFQEGGKWYNKEKEFCNQLDQSINISNETYDTESIEILTKKEIAYLVNNLIQFLDLKISIEKLKEDIWEVLNQNLEYFIPNKEFSKLPILNINDSSIHYGPLQNVQYASAINGVKVLNNNIKDYINKTFATACTKGFATDILGLTNNISGLM